MSVTEETIQEWINQKRGMACMPRESMTLCVGQHVKYFDKQMNATRIASIVSLGPLMYNDAGLGEPASVTIQFDDGSERNTTLSRLSPV